MLKIQAAARLQADLAVDRPWLLDATDHKELDGVLLHELDWDNFPEKGMQITDSAFHIPIKDGCVPAVRKNIQELGWTPRKVFPAWNINTSDFEYYQRGDLIAILNAADYDTSLVFRNLASTLHPLS